MQHREIFEGCEHRGQREQVRARRVMQKRKGSVHQGQEGRKEGGAGCSARGQGQRTLGWEAPEGRL